MKIKHFLIGTMVFASFFLLLTIWNNVAASSNTIPYNGWCCGGTKAEARVRALAYNANQGSCDITSSTSPATTVNVIGWHWWQCDSLEYVGANPLNSSSHGGHSPPIGGSSRGATTQVNYCNFAYSPPRCGFKVRAHGVHVFNHNGASQWTPYNTTKGP